MFDIHPDGHNTRRIFLVSEIDLYAMVTPCGESFFLFGKRLRADTLERGMTFTSDIFQTRIPACLFAVKINTCAEFPPFEFERVRGLLNSSKRGIRRPGGQRVNSRAFFPRLNFRSQTASSSRSGRLSILHTTLHSLDSSHKHTPRG